jgi:hypothetical protein
MAGKIALDWDAAVGDGNITYALYFREGIVNFTREGLVGPPQATFNSTTFRAELTNLTLGTKYSLLVLAVGEDGNESGNREAFYVTVASVDPVLWGNNTLVRFDDSTTTLAFVSAEEITLTSTELPLPEEFQVGAYFLAPQAEGDVGYVQILSINVALEDPLFVAELTVRPANFTEVYQEYEFDVSLDAAPFLTSDGDSIANVALTGDPSDLARNRRRLLSISRTFSRTATNDFGPFQIVQTFSTTVTITASFKVGLNRVCRRICFFRCRTICFPNPLDPFVRAGASAMLGASYSFNALGAVSASTDASSNLELFKGPKVLLLSLRFATHIYHFLQPSHARPARLAIITQPPPPLAHQSAPSADQSASRPDPDHPGARH